MENPEHRKGPVSLVQGPLAFEGHGEGGPWGFRPRAGSVVSLLVSLSFLEFLN